MEEKEEVEDLERGPQEVGWTKTFKDFSREDFRAHLLETKDEKSVDIPLDKAFFDKLPVFLVRPHQVSEGSSSQLNPDDSEATVVIQDREGNLLPGYHTLDLGEKVRCHLRKQKREF